MKKTKASHHAHHTGGEVKETDQRQILNLIQEYQRRYQPITTDFLRIALGKPKSTITARLALLQAWGLVYATGQTENGSTLWAYEVSPIWQEGRGRAYRKKRHLSRVLGILRDDLEFCPPFLVHALKRHLEGLEQAPQVAAKVLSTPPDKFMGL